MLNTLKIFLATIFMSAMLTAGLAGCDVNEGPAEEAGESIDSATTDMGNAIEDACEDMKEGAGAKDTDC